MVVKGVRAAEDWQRVQNQTNAVLKSTGLESEGKGVGDFEVGVHGLMLAVRPAGHHPHVAIDTYDFTRDEVGSRVHALFEAAKAADEFEFGCTLLRIRGIEEAGWDPFVETYRLVEDLMGMIKAPLIPHSRVRLWLLLYSHLTEVGAVYDMLANLTRVLRGERYVMDPFLDHYPRNKKGEALWLSTPGKVRAVQSMLEDAGYAGLVEVLDWFFYPPVRNAFAHADYTLYEDKFRTRLGLFEVGGIRTPELPLETLGNLVNRALGFYGAFIDEYEEQRGGYTENKTLTGRIGPGEQPMPVELLADAEQGLYGFRSPPGGAGAD